MYFWRIDALKVELRAGPLPAARVLPYLLGYGLLTTIVAQLAIFMPLPDANRWDVIHCLGTVVLTCGGLLLAYYANGGAQGTDFAARLFALAWVVGWRLSAVFFLLMIGSAIIAPQQFATDVTATTPVLVLISSICQLAFWWRLWVHLRDVGRPSPTSVEVAPASNAA